MTSQTLAQTLAQHVTGSHNVTPELHDWMQLLLFDFVGVSLGGAGLDSAQAARAATTVSNGKSAHHSALILGTNSWATPEDAALVNGVTAHGLELDDTFEEASLHPGVAIFPALLALADEHELPLEDLLPAAIVGYDVMCTVGVVLGARESYGRGFHPTGVVGVLGSAAAAAKVMGLSVDQTRHALGLAANMASGSLEFLSDGSWTKRLNAGHAASTGIRAAKLAAAGFTGPERSLEGRDGFLSQYGQGMQAGRTPSLRFGQSALQTSIKFYPCCRYMHGNIDLLRGIHRDIPNLTIQAIESIEVGVIKAGAALVSEPAERKLLVSSTVDAQFNMPFGAALALSTGNATVEQFANAPRIAEELGPWLKKVRCYTSDALEAAFPASWQAEVQVRLTDGNVISRSEKAFRGSAGDRAGWKDIEEKIAGLLGFERAARLAAAIRAMNLQGIRNDEATSLN
jgi:2-methylcitrate dehydratase PrpD